MLGFPFWGGLLIERGKMMRVVSVAIQEHKTEVILSLAQKPHCNAVF
jgi:hypothetical protein